MGQIKIRKLIEVNVLYGLSTELSQSFSHQLVVSGWVLWHPVLQYSYSNAGIECLEVLKIIHIWRYSKLKWPSPQATFLCLVLINLPRSIQDFLKYFQPLLLPCCRRQSQRAQGSRGAAASRTDRLWIVGSWNTLSWTGTAKIIKHNSWLPKNSNHNSDSIAPALLEFQQAWCHQYFFGEPVPEPDPSLMQLQAIPLWSYFQRTEISACSSTHKGATGHHETSPQSSLPHTQTKWHQLLLTSHPLDLSLPL